MRRRDFIVLVGGATAGPLSALAQQARKKWRIGFLSGGSPAASASILSGFPEGMRELGYTEGRDFVIEWRYGEGKYERFAEFAKELVRDGVDIFVVGTTAAVHPIQEVTQSIPIVLGYSTDPVGSRFVESLAHPGGQITGLAGSSDDTAPKQIELLGYVVPNLARLGVLQNPASPISAPNLAATQRVTKAKGIDLRVADAETPDQIASAFQTLAREKVQAIKVSPDALFMISRQRIATIALEKGLPSMYPQREFAEVGGLMSYGESLREFFREAATYVDRIMKGARPADLPVEQPARFKLVINRKTADALGVILPSQLYMLADEVIE